MLHQWVPLALASGLHIPLSPLAHVSRGGVSTLSQLLFGPEALQRVETALPYLPQYFSLHCLFCSVLIV